jgi:hypothetical protein
MAGAGLRDLRCGERYASGNKKTPETGKVSGATEEKKTIGFARALAVSDSFLLALGRLLGGCEILVVRLS